MQSEQPIACFQNPLQSEGCEAGGCQLVSYITALTASSAAGGGQEEQNRKKTSTERREREPEGGSERPAAPDAKHIQLKKGNVRKNKKKKRKREIKKERKAK